MKYLTNALREFRGLKISQYSKFTKIEYDSQIWNLYTLSKRIWELDDVTENDARETIKIYRK